MSGIDIEGTLSDHFVMLAELEGDGPPHVWRCQCGAKFGFSDSVIAHVAAVLRAQIEGALAEAWEQGAFYYGGDPAEHWYFSGGGLDENPYRAAHLSDTERAGS